MNRKSLLAAMLMVAAVFSFARPAFAQDQVANAPAVEKSLLDKAKDQFRDAAKARGLDATRVDAYLKQLDQTAARFGTSEKQLVESLDNLTAVLKLSSSVHYDADWRARIVETALHNLAYPSEIDQGYHPTCNVTTVEVFAAARYPDRYTALIKEIVETGKYTTDGGKQVTPPKAALMPGEDEKTYDLAKPNQDKRNIASQIVQMTLINGTYELGLVKKLQDVRQPDGSIKKEMVAQTDTRYILGKKRQKPIPNGYIILGEDLLVDKNGNAKIDPRTGDPVDGPEFTQAEVLESSKMMLGKEMPYIKNPYKTSTYDPYTGVTTETPWIYDLPTKERLLKAKADGMLPLGVPTIGGAHVQTIHDVQIDSQGRCWILLDNQHGDSHDGWVTLEELHRTQQEDLHLKPKYRPHERPYQ